jgi:ribosome-associated protein
MNSKDQKLIENLINKVTEIADEKKASNIRVYKTNNSWLTDFIIVLSANNIIHNKALLTAINETARAFLKINPCDSFHEFPKVSGTTESGWVILDLNSILIHVLLSDLRLAYSIDEFFERDSIVYHN